MESTKNRPRRPAASAMSRFIGGGMLLIGLVGCTASEAPDATDGAAGSSSPHWVGTWHSAVRDNQSSTENITYRLLIHNAVGGKAVRLRFSNRYGAEALTLRNVSIALPSSPLKLPPVDAATVTPLSFNGRREVQIPAGQELRSDPVAFALPADADIAVTFHVPEAVSNVTAKGLTLTTSWSNGANGGDATGDDAGLSLTTPEFGWPFLTGLEVDAAGATTVVALGDSITDGAFETPNSDMRWPDLLNDRIAGSDLAGRRSVVNAGISGNMVTGERSGNASEGEPAVVRMAWDVFEQPNLSHLIVFEGINDVSVGVPGSEIVEGLRTILAGARKRGVKVIVATLTPSFGATGDDGGSTLNEGQRQPVNDWVLTSGEPDGVIDFNTAVRVGLGRDIWLPALTVDFLHPNPAGLAVMADAIPLDVLR